MSKNKHINVIIADIKVAIPYSPEDNLLTLTTQIREQARRLTGYVDCIPRLGKISAPVPSTITEPLIPDTEPLIPDTPLDAVVADEMDLPAFLKREK